MPLPLISLPHAQQPAHQVQELPGGLVVEWREQSLSFSPRVLRFTNGVVAKYGETTVKCDELEIHQDAAASYAIAQGHVSLYDPLGKLTGRRLKFSWLDRTGMATDVDVVIDSLKAHVANVTLEPLKWTFKDVRGTGYANRVALLNLSAPRVDVVPGKTVVVRKPKVGILGALVGPLPDAHSNLTGGSTGFRYPTPSYKQDHGFGISWESRIPLSHASMFTGSYGNYARTVPSYSFNFTHSFLDDGRLENALPPRYDLGDRFDFSYFQSVLVSDPKSDWYTYGNRRSRISVGTVSNSPASGRDDFGHYSKPWDVAFEQSGVAGSTALYGQVRAQQIRRGSDPLKNRVVGWFAAAPMPLALSKNLSAYGSVEAMTFSDSGFHWARVQSGLAFQPVSFLRFSGAGFWGGEWGSPSLAADQLDRRSGFVARGDLITGPSQFSYLMKFDPRGGGQYDREYSYTQAIGILSAYINYRKYPSRFRYGVLLRLDEILNGFSKRREAPNPAR